MNALTYTSCRARSKISVLSIGFLLLAIPLFGQSADQEKQPSETIPFQAEAAAIQANARAFTDAYNSGDAKAIAKLWTIDGDYVDEAGVRTVGREAIEEQYADLFSRYGQARMSLSIDAIKFLDDTTAIEDGIARMELTPLAATATARYVVVHVKRDGEWLISSVRDIRSDALQDRGGSTDASDLQPLAWLIGHWEIEGPEATVDMTCRWVAQKRYLERKFTTRSGDQILIEGTQLIGLDPTSGRIHSWTFDSTGGRSESVWHPSGKGWVIQSNGILSDGSLSTSRNLVDPIDENTFRWQSVARNVHDVTLPDSDPVEAKRVAQ